MPTRGSRAGEGYRVIRGWLVGGVFRQRCDDAVRRLAVARPALFMLWIAACAALLT
jgi:hypothetical protein